MIGLLEKAYLPIRIKGNSERTSSNSLIPLPRAQNKMTLLAEVKLSLRRRLISVWHKTRVTFCSSIVACPAGTFFHQESSSCTACSKGTYQDKEGQSSCKPCSDEKTTDKKGAEAANDCEPSKNR